MTLSDYLRVLREKWILLAVCLALGIGGAVLATMTSPKQYQASATLVISPRVATDSTDSAYSATLLAQLRSTSYSELLTSQRVSQDVINRLGLNETAADLASSLGVSAQSTSVVIYLTATNGSPDRAVQIANAVADSFTRMVAELEQTPDSNLPPPVTVRVVDRATPPATLSAPKTTTNLALGVAAGLVIGIGAAFVRNNLDNSVRTDSQLAELLGAPNLGVIAFDRKAAKHPLTTGEPPHSARAETFRQIRTNVKFVGGARPPQVIAITSAVPGEGKTTTVCNLAIAMAEARQRVLLIEADLRRPKAADYLGIARDVGLTSVLTGTAQFHDAVQHWREGSFDVLTSGPVPENPTSLLSAYQLSDVLDAARATYDVVLIDTPPVLNVVDVAELAPLTDGVILVVRIGKTRRDQIQAAVNTVAAVSSPVLGSVMSMAPRKISATVAYRAPQSPALGVTSPQPAHAGAGVDHGQAGPPSPADWSPSPVPRPLPGEEAEARHNDRPIGRPTSE